MKTEIRCRREVWRNKIDVLLLQTAPTGEVSYLDGADVPFAPLGPGEAIGSPTLSMSPHEAQMLMDELWLCGLRPTEGTGSAGSLAATQRHLEDMRQIAFGMLNKSGVQTK